MYRGLVVVAALAACGDNVHPAATITGAIWSDDNGNGVRDPDELPVPDVVVYANLDFDPSINFGDPVTRTGADGSYTLEVPGPGTYAVRAVLPFGVRGGSPAGKPRIIGGGEVGSAGDYSFMVALAFRSGDFTIQYCGGALITDRHVVTAAHCSTGVPLSEVAILAGTLEPFSDGTTGHVFDVAQIEVHPTFNFDAAHGYDIAVWTLAEPIDLEATGLHTIEMVGESTAALADPGALATTIGWGTSDLEGGRLQQVHVPVVSDEDCATAYPMSSNLDTQLCAGVPEGGIDSCQGDSGGPLIVRDFERQVWLHAGITSYGQGCAQPGFPGVYSEMATLSSWAIDHATEATDPVDVTITDFTMPGVADFAALIATRPQVGAIAPRWQLTGFSLESRVVPDEQVTATFRIVGDPDAPTDMTCRFEADVIAGTSQEIPCGLGETTATLAGFPTGLYLTSLTVESGDVSFSRRIDVTSGAPPTTKTLGALEAQDPIDPDYSAPYHIDYYDVGDLSGTKAFAIEARSTSLFTMFLTLYDADQRDFDLGGGLLQFGQFLEGNERMIVIPEPGKHYVVGISSLEQAALGTYEVLIINDGVLTPR